MAGESSSRLRRVYRNNPEEINTIFIVVRGVGTLSAEHWNDDTGRNWLRTVGGPSATVLSFDHGLASDGTLSWPQIQAEGDRLLSEMTQMTEQYAESPVVLIAHSLGGLILKRAVCIAHRQQRWSPLLERVAGAVLFSCPHSKSADLVQWQKLELITKTYAKQKVKISPELAESLTQDCLCFEEQFKEKDVLSIHEKVETSTGKAFWHKAILVGSNFAHPTVGHSTTLGVNCEHNKTCCLKSDKNLSSVTLDFIARVVTQTRRDIAFSALWNYDRSPMETPTLPSESAPGSVSGNRSSRQQPLLSGASASSFGLSKTTTARTRDTDPSTAPSRGPRDSLPIASSMKPVPNLPCFMMPYDQSSNFYGRRQMLDQISEVLDPVIGDRRDPKAYGLNSYAISGPGGMGKTQVAIQFVYEHRTSFDAIFWVHADDLAKLKGSFGKIAVVLGIVKEDTAEAQDEVMTRDLVLNWLRQPRKPVFSEETEGNEVASWLLIFDNADDPGLLDDFWPRASTGSILITSRDPLRDLRPTLSTNGVLEPFNSDETADLLLKITQREHDEADRNSVGAVAKILGGIPLAIAQIGGSIVRRDMTFAEFLQEYNDPYSHARLFRQPLRGVKQQQGYEHTMLSAWSTENLGTSANLLDILAFLDPDGIPEDILQSNKASLDMQKFPSPTREYLEARDGLIQSSLVSRDRSARKLVVHRLIQDTVRAKMEDERYNIVFVSALQLLSEVWPYEQEFGFIKDETYRWRLCNELYKHVLHLKKLLTRLTPPTKISRAHIQPPKLILEAAWLSVMRADYAETTPLIEMAEALCKPLDINDLAPDGGDVAIRGEFEEVLRMFYFQRGALAHHINEPETALDNFLKFTNIKKKTLAGNQDLGLGIAMNELGVAYLHCEVAGKSEQCFQESIAILNGLEGISPNTHHMPLINLGFCFWLQGRLEDAEKLFQSTLDEREDAYGPNDTISFALGKLLLGFGNVKAALGKLDESYNLHERCLAQYKANLGPFHHRTGDGCIHVATHYMRQGKLSEALVLLNQASRILGTKQYFKPERARVNHKRYKVLRGLGLQDEAKVSAKNALDLYRAVNPKDKRELDALSDEDFDKSIMFWSR